MRSSTLFLAMLIVAGGLFAAAEQADAQLLQRLLNRRPQANPVENCPGGQCPTAPVQAQRPSVDTPPNILTLAPLDADSDIDVSDAGVHQTEAVAGVDRLRRVVEATCRVTVSGVCGSGTVVGRDSDGLALVLTNAHVAGSRKGRRVSVQRWDFDGKSERGTGEIIAAGYSRGLSVDFALLRCSSGFASDVMPVPLADRHPQANAGVSTYGCPRCEWPSMQVLSMTKSSGQILRWKPEAIGGRSGSSVIDYTESGPRVVGLLTWGGGGEGLGQSTPFILDALRGRMPRSFEQLPGYARELAAPLKATDLTGRTGLPAVCGPSGDRLTLAQLTEQQQDALDDETHEPAERDVIDDITEDGPDPDPDCPDEDSPGDGGDGGDVEPGGPCGPEEHGFLGRLVGFLRRSIFVAILILAAAVVGYVARGWIDIGSWLGRD